MIKQYVKKNGTKAWMFNEYIGTNPTTGKKKIVTKRGFKSEKEAKATLNRLKVDFERGELQTMNRIRFDEVYQLWLEEHHRMVKAGTVVTTKRYTRIHVLPLLGDNSFRILMCSFARKP